jgi:formate dehydrogenase (NADP+) alpha subunit
MNMKQIKFILNGNEIITNENTTILRAALDNGIYIPNLCFHPDLRPVGACRLCLVEVENRGKVTACNTPASEGMIVNTDTQEIERIRRFNVGLLLANHKGSCTECSANTKCELQKIAKYAGISPEYLQDFIRPERNLFVDESNPFFTLDNNKCVLCGICVRTCHELQGMGAIDFVNRGFTTTVAPFNKHSLKDSRCASCGECVVRCPTGALAEKHAEAISHEVKSICPYCGCGCALYLGVRGNRVVSVRGDKDGAANFGSLCVKGRFGFGFINSSERLTTPLIKRDGVFVAATWDEALDLVASKLAQYKGDQFALLASAKFTNEDNYVIQKFTRAVMQTNNIDHCARLCHAPTVAGLAQTLGSGAMTNTISEIQDANCIFALGTNTTTAHPIIALKIKKAVSKGAHLIVANPKEIELCRHAELFLQHRPGTDVALLMGMIKVIFDEQLHDAKFVDERTENFAAMQAVFKDFPLDVVANITGVSGDLIVKAARLYATSKPATILYAMGITQHSHGTDNVIATSNLALLCGNLGKYGAGVNPLRGQNNVQGACDMGALPNVFPGYQNVTDAAANAKFTAAYGVSLPNIAGLTHTEMFNAICEGKVAMMYVAGENPMLSEANLHHVEEALRKLKFLVVQDIFLTETAKLADVVLPATSFAEKDGTFTNTERRVQLLHRAIPNVGEARDDWWIICQLAARLNGNNKGFAYQSTAEIMDEIVALVPSYHGITYARLADGSLQWPCPDTNHPGTPILHIEKFATTSGKGKFVPLQFKPPYELPDSEYPLLLTTDRSLFQFHTATMSRKVAGLNVLRSEELVEINPEDAVHLKIADGEMVKVTSRRGTVQTRAKVTDIVPVGVVAMTFHFAESPTNLLTSPAIDPVAKIPETKVCAVKIEKL